MKVLLTGSTGYIGRRLKNILLIDNAIDLRLFIRSEEIAGIEDIPGVKVYEGDTFNVKALSIALKGVDVAIYLIHSMAAKDGDYTELDRISAANFRNTCIENGVKRIIYLGGLGIKETASKHLKSRIETGEILSEYPDKIQTLWFRAGIIIGSGGASYEIIRNLVEKLPVMITPRWIRTKTQAIGVDDVLKYLHRAIHLNMHGNLIVDLGAEQITFEKMLKDAAYVLGLKRLIIPVFLFSPSLSSYWLVFFSPVPYRIASALIMGLKSETIVQNDNAGKYFPEIRPKSYIESFNKALNEAGDDRIISRWCDSTSEAICDITAQEKLSNAVKIDKRIISAGEISSAVLFKSILSIGGYNGWFSYNLLWHLRGLFDKLIGGYGLNRGRRSLTTLRIGDALDFWKVADLKHNRRLLLLSQMKLPGKAWLEFVIEKGNLIQTAYFIPVGLGGRLYWYILFPFHCLIFRGMIRKIIKNAYSTTNAV